MNSQSFTITKGPSKFDLSIALLSDIKDGKYPHSVEFAVFDPTIGGPAIQKVVVLSIEAEDGSRESWNIADYKIWGDDAKRFTGRYVKIYFRTDRPVAVCSSWTEQPPDRKSTRLNSSHLRLSRMPSSA